MLARPAHGAGVRHAVVQALSTPMFHELLKSLKVISCLILDYAGGEADVA